MKSNILIERFEACLSAIEGNLTRKRDVEDLIQTNNSAIRYLEIDAKEKINEAVDIEGKKLYTNSEMRENAVYKYLDKLPEYQALKKDNYALNKELSEVNGSLETLKYRFRMLQAFVELAKLEV